MVMLGRAKQRDLFLSSQLTYTAQPLQGASPKLNLQEVTVQGNQVKAVTETLVERGVPKRCIRELEGDKKKK